MHDGGLYIPEISPFKITPQLHLAEAQPDVGIHFPRFFELMTSQVQNRDAAPRFQNWPSLGYGTLGMRRMMKRLAEKCEIHLATFYGNGFHISQPELEVGQSMLSRQACAEVNHLL